MQALLSFGSNRINVTTLQESSTYRVRWKQLSYPEMKKVVRLEVRAIQIHTQQLYRALRSVCMQPAVSPHCALPRVCSSEYRTQSCACCLLPVILCASPPPQVSVVKMLLLLRQFSWWLTCITSEALISL